MGTNTCKLSRKNFWILFSLSSALFIYHLISAAYSGYGYFVDELYYVACSKRLAFGYIDQPPLSIFLLAVNRFVFGESITAIRILPALSIASTVFITGVITNRLGGNSWGIIASALAVMAAPVYMIFGSFYSMNSYEIFIWALILYFSVKMVQENNSKNLLWIFLLIGLGLEMKHTMLLYGIALFFGILATDKRNLLWSKWFLWGTAIALIVILPNLIWQYTHGFPSFEFYKNAMGRKNISTPPLGVLFDQLLYMNPLTAILWLTGLYYLLFSDDYREYRFLGIAFLILIGFMILSQSSRPDRISSIYSILFSAGAAAVSRINRSEVKKYLFYIVNALIVLGGLFFLPIATPLLPPPVLAKYIALSGLSFDIEAGKQGEALPQWLADRLGWEELAKEVDRVINTLSAEEKKNTVIISNSYGEAGALELYGTEPDFPKVYSTHNSYHTWGPPSDSVKTYIAVFVERRDLESRFGSVEDAGLQTCEYCTRPQRRIPIYIARNPNFSIQSEWKNFKNFH